MSVRMASTTKSYLDLINDCDRFPYDDPLKLGDHWSQIYQFMLPDDPRTHGFMLASTVKKMPWISDFVIDHKARTVRLSPSKDNGDPAAACTTAFSKLIQRIIDEDTFRVIHGTHSEPYPIIGANFSVSMERYASTLFGIVSRGAHLTVYTKTASGMKIWVPRRSSNLFTYPNCLDTTVAGGVTFGEGPFECIIREADEEASLPEDLIRKQVVPCGCISYMGLNDRGGGGEAGLIAPDIMFVYDLEIPEGVVCKQNDDEVKEFYLMTVSEVRECLARAEFKTNSALVMIDFFIRHGIITAENEKNYADIIARLHRKLPLPTTPQ